MPKSKPTRLSASDRKFLLQQEKIVTNGTSAVTQIAAAICGIHEYKKGILWRTNFESFEAYVETRWGYTKAHTYRLLGFGKFVAELEKRRAESPQLETIASPTRESHVRPFLELKHDPVGGWISYMESKPVKVTSANASAFCSQLNPSGTGIPATPEGAPTGTPAVNRAYKALAECRAAMAALNTEWISYLASRVQSLGFSLLDLDDAADLVLTEEQMVAALSAVGRLKAFIPETDAPVRGLLLDLEQRLGETAAEPCLKQAMETYSEMTAALAPILRRDRLLKKLEAIQNILGAELHRKP